MIVSGLGSGPAWPVRAGGCCDSKGSQAAALGRKSALAAARVSAELQQAGSLQIVTDDGDKVTISFAALQQMQAESVEATGEGAAASYQNLLARSSMTSSLKVEGSLDREELSDIRKLMRTIAKATRDVQRGDIGKAAARMARTSSLDSLQSFQYAYQQNARLEVTTLNAGTLDLAA